MIHMFIPSNTQTMHMNCLYPYQPSPIPRFSHLKWQFPEESKPDEDAPRYNFCEQKQLISSQFVILYGLITIL